MEPHEPSSSTRDEAARRLRRSTPAAPAVDLRDRRVDTCDLADLEPMEWCREYVRRFVSGSDDRASRRLTDDTIKGYDRNRGADRHQLAALLDALDHGRPVACYGWWPAAEAVSVTDILGVDAMDVLPPDRKGSELFDGQAVVVVGYGRHDAFPGGGYLIARTARSPESDDRACVFVPFTYVRAYAIALHSVRIDTGYVGPAGGPTGGLPIGAIRHPVDVEIAKKARCADPRASYTDLFFSENAMDTARAKAICSRCEVRDLCLGRALERQEPYGVWGGEFLLDGEIVVTKRGRGRPRTIPLPTDVDEVTGMPVVA